jgi:hypothetical protein
MISYEELFEPIAYRMESEGLDYCFRHYSDFNEIKDEEFHRLKKIYIAAAEEIELYVKSKIKD